MSITNPSDTPKPTTAPTSAPTPAPRRRRHPLLRIVRFAVILLLSILALIILAIGASVWILTPERLTPLVTGIANKNLNATVEASRIELTFWSTFPRLTVDVDSLTLVSHSLRGLDAQVRRKLPANADSLFCIGSFSAGVDVLGLLIGQIHLYDVDLRSPRLNILQVDSLHNNFTIVPPSEESQPSAPLKLPGITINRFTIADGFPVSFTSLADSLSVSVDIAAGTISGNEAPRYTLSVNGKGAGGLGSFRLLPIPFGIDGCLSWKAQEPGALQANDMQISAGKVALTFDAAVQLLDSMAVNQLRVVGKEIRIADVIQLIPEQYRGSLKPLDTDLAASFSAELLAPYTPSSRRIPPVKLRLTFPRGKLTYDRLVLNGIEADIAGTIHPSAPNRSEISVKAFSVSGRAMDFSLTGSITSPLSDPHIIGTFNGSVDFSRLPVQLTSRLPARISGVLKGNASFDIRQSHLTQRGFHRMKINGEISLSDFRAYLTDSDGMLYTRHALLKFGTSNSIKVNGQRIDSLLTASLTVDTIATSIPGVMLTASGMEMGFGSRNVASSTDTSRINPLGASIRLHRLAIRCDSDSARFMLRDAFVKASLQRYQSQARSPLLNLDLSMGRLRAADRYNRLSLSEASASLTLHPRSRPTMSRRFQAAYDSIAAARPSLSTDSLMSLTRAHLRHKARLRNASAKRSDVIDFGVDNSLRSWLRLWRVQGTLKARRARLFTPYFPVRNTISGLDLSFSTDSVTLRNTTYKMGRNDFLINGSITNISRALTSAGRVPLKVTFNVDCDSLNINDITRALMLGAAFSDRISKGSAVMPDDDSDEKMSAHIEQQLDDAERAPILVPTNITANIAVRAANMKYGDILFQRFTGNIEARDGSVRLNRLGAFTPMGSFGMTALYTAPTKDDIRFAGGIVVRRLDLRQFLNMIPEIDSVIPMLRSMEGIITAECGMTTDIDTAMNLKFHTLDMALKISGDSLVLLDSETFRKLSKWLLFKNKNRNMIDSMSVEMIIRDSRLQLYPFLVNLDRYRFGISGGNDLGLNLDYHVAVLKSPIPFKFGVNIKGTPDHLKIRLGRARFNEKQVASSRQLTDTARINLIRKIRNIFQFGVRNSRHVKLTLSEPKPSQSEYLLSDTISAADSLFFIRQGVIPKPKGWIDPDSVAAHKAQADKPKQKRKKFLLW